MAKTALGRGLDALIPDKKGREIVDIEITRITAGREQPRKAFNDERLKELSESIRERGVLQPVLVKREPDGSFSLIAGERRTRAAQLAGLKRIPAIIREDNAADTLEIALIENIQREDLNPIETAGAFDRLIKEFGLTQEQVSSRVGKERATVANYLRLLGLPDEIKVLLVDGQLTMGHARAILSIEGKAAQMEAARTIIRKGLSVREAERLAKNPPVATGKIARAKKAALADPHSAEVEQKLIRSLGTKVRLRHNQKTKHGTIEIEYYSLEELDRLLDIMLGT